MRRGLLRKARATGIRRPARGPPSGAPMKSLFPRGPTRAQKTRWAVLSEDNPRALLQRLCALVERTRSCVVPSGAFHALAVLHHGRNVVRVLLELLLDNGRPLVELEAEDAQDKRPRRVQRQQVGVRLQEQLREAGPEEGAVDVHLLRLGAVELL